LSGGLFRTDYVPLNQIPEEFQTSSLCETAVVLDPDNLDHLPRKFLTKEFFLQLKNRYNEVKQFQGFSVTDPAEYTPKELQA
jgi:hypothetical protein